MVVNTRQSWLDGIRCIASIAVVYFHLSEVFPKEQQSWYRDMVKLGWLGVPVFFFISGYCIRMVIDRSGSPGEFWLRRFWRIFPPYYFSLLVVLAVIAIRVVTYGYNDIIPLPKDPASILATLSLLTAPATSVVVINWVYWSLTYEVVFYFFIGLTLALQAKYRIWAVVAISLMSCFAPQLEGYKLFFFLNQWPCFAIGYFIFAWQTDSNKTPIAFCLLFAVLAFFLNLPSLSHGIPGVYTLAYTSICLLALFQQYIPLQWPGFLNRLGLYSYSLYLIHVPIGVYLLGRLRPQNIVTSPWTHFLLDSLILVILLVLSYLMFRWVEKPSVELGKRLTQR